MRAVKGNMEYDITEAQRKDFVKQGFDIIDGTGKVVEHGAGKTVPYAIYQKSLDELKRVKSELAELKGQKDLEDMKKPELISLAKSLGLTVEDKATSSQLIDQIRKAQGEN